MEETPRRLENKAGRPRFRIGLVLFGLGFHGLVVLLVAVLLAAPFVDTSMLQALWEAGKMSGYGYLLGTEALIHVGVAACLWAALYLSWLALRQGGGSAKRAIRRARGSVLTETLIILPVLLVLIFGLAQLAVTNIAGMLTNLAAVNAGRTVWLWLPETSPIGGASPRGGVTREHVGELARIQAAAALTPVAPADLRIRPDVGSDLFKLMRGSFVANQLEWLPNDAGRIGVDEAFRLSDGGGENPGDDLSFSRALDGSSFLVRSARKFGAAYEATEVEVLERGEWLGARVTYKQLAAFPVTNRIFGNLEVVGQRKGYYTTIVREFDLKTQPEPNAKFPRRTR